MSGHMHDMDAGARLTRSDERLLTLKTLGMPKSSGQGGARGVKSASGDDSSGPCIIVAVVGYPRGRWHDEINDSTGTSAKELMTSLLDSAQHCSRSQSGVQWTDDFLSNFPAGIIGFAKVESWSLKSGAHASNQAVALMRCLQVKFRRCQSLAFLQHHFLSSAILESVISLDDFDPLQGRAIADVSLLSNLKMFIPRPAHTTDREITGMTGLTYVWSMPNDATVYIWPIWWPLAWLIARGHWTVDVSPIVPRFRRSEWRPPVQPVRRTMTAIRTSRVSDNVPTEEQSTEVEEMHFMDVTVTKQKARSPFIMHVFHAEHLIRAVIAGRHLKSTASAERSVNDHLTLIFPEHGSELQSGLNRKGFKVPQREVNRLARIRMDVAAMMCHREWSQRVGPLFRYIASDASPQQRQSTEMFVTVERVVPYSALKNRTVAEINTGEIIRRTLPLTTLGHGMADLPSKVITQAFCNRHHAQCHIMLVVWICVVQS